MGVGVRDCSDVGLESSADRRETLSESVSTSKRQTNIPKTIIRATKMTASPTVTIARNLIQPTDGVPLCDSGMAFNLSGKSGRAARKNHSPEKRKTGRIRSVKYLMVMVRSLKNSFVFATLAFLTACQTPQASNQQDWPARNGQSSSPSSQYEVEPISGIQRPLGAPGTFQPGSGRGP